MTVCIAFTILLFINNKILFTYGIDYYSTYNWKFHFPEGSSMGLFFALAFPLDAPNNNVFVSYNFEGVYSLPGNDTREDFPPLVERSDVARTFKDDSEGMNHKQVFKTIDRKLVYDGIEAKMTSLGYHGRPCLLRAICETALIPVTEINGVLGDLFHIIFTPSSSLNEGLINIYERAENDGKFQDCRRYHRNCSTSFLDLISLIDHT